MLGGAPSTSFQDARRLANRALLRKLEALWDAVPEQRFGQLVMNLSRTDNDFADTREWSNATWGERIDKYHALWAQPTRTAAEGEER